MTPFLFDIGNVLLRFDFAIAAAKVAPLCPPDTDPLAVLTPLQRELECGHVDGDAFVTEAIKHLGYRGEPEAFREAYVDIFTPNLPMADLVASLGEQGHPLYLLSNTSDLHKDYFFARYPEIFGHFSGAAYSYEAGSMKPDDGIYEAVFRELPIGDPGGAIYLDDLPANVEAGRRFGLRSFQYVLGDHGALLDWLQDEGVAV